MSSVDSLDSRVRLCRRTITISIESSEYSLVFRPDFPLTTCSLSGMTSDFVKVRTSLAYVA
jgi:hypothetical protein